MSFAIRHIFGEVTGTSILVFWGCGSVAYNNLISPLSLPIIAIIWGLAVAAAIFISRKWSHAHLNPAVSLGFLVGGELSHKSFLAHIFGQMIGAAVAAVLLFIIFKPLLVSGSIQEAMIFGEYYPNPGSGITKLSTPLAAIFEGFGTFLLMMGVLGIIRIKQRNFQPILIGVLLAILIILIAPYTQAGFNPARDAMPRLISYLAGYDMAYSYNGWGNIIVYICSPLIGAASAILVFKQIIRN